MIFRVPRSFGFLLLFGSLVAQASAQKFTDPDTLAPAFPTPQTIVERMLTLAQVKPGETVYDLGCGDGRIVITAAQQFKAHAVGIEIRRDIYEATLGRVNSLGLNDRVKIIHGNALRTDLRPADVVTLYLLTSSNEKLKPVLTQYLKPTARVVSHDFEIRGWKASAIERMKIDGHPHTIYLYRMDSK
ncbi:MAG TPA: class I SAM-dependent methyltransferase [Bryobacteraceae bacterium]|nr:class I SAM-dependent methyltransferase [Bryobacteraceae bacterium]